MSDRGPIENVNHRSNHPGISAPEKKIMSVLRAMLAGAGVTAVAAAAMVTGASAAHAEAAYPPGPYSAGIWPPGPYDTGTQGSEAPVPTDSGIIVRDADDAEALSHRGE